MCTLSMVKDLRLSQRTKIYLILGVIKIKRKKGLAVC